MPVPDLVLHSILLVGVFGGVTWEQRNVASLVIDLQNQIGQLQQDLKAPRPPAAEPSAKRRGGQY
jgi:outer membrane murein-binding lipoprotein Lpp